MASKKLQIKEGDSWEVTWRTIESLMPYVKNPRNNDEAVPRVQTSIDDFDWQVPILVDKNDVIIAGHTRLKAAQALGLTLAPVRKASELTAKQVKAYRLVDNKTGEYSRWVAELASAEVSELKAGGVDTVKYDLDDLIRTDAVDETNKGNVEFGGDRHLLQVECNNEQELQSLYDEMMGRELTCKILN